MDILKGILVEGWKYSKAWRQKRTDQCRERRNKKGRRIRWQRIYSGERILRYIKVSAASIPHLFHL